VGRPLKKLPWLDKEPGTYRLFVAICPYYWGAGETMLEAEKALRAAGGKIGTRGKDSHCYLTPRGAAKAWVEPIGDLAWEFPRGWQSSDAEKRAVKVY